MVVVVGIIKFIAFVARAAVQLKTFQLHALTVGFCPQNGQQSIKFCSVVDLYIFFCD